MFDNVVLGVVIGLIFVYLLYSLLATIIMELIATKLSFRSKVLEKAIVRMLEDGKSTTHARITDRLKAFVHLFFGLNLLKDKTVAPWFYAHPLIKYLAEDNRYNKPAYIKGENFAKVMVDLLKGFGSSNVNDVQKINDSINNGTIYHLPINLQTDPNHPAIEAIVNQININQGQVLGATGNPADTVTINKDTHLFLMSIWQDANADLDVFRTKLEFWFDDTMERTTGWYKRYTKFILFAIGLIIAVGFNVDTISIAKKLSKDPVLREEMIKSADLYLKNNPAPPNYTGQVTNTNSSALSDEENAKIADRLHKRGKDLLDSVNGLIHNDIKNANELLGLGWRERKVNQHSCLHGFLCLRCNHQGPSAIIGWILTALALSLGAPFWFDMLNKIMKIRGAGQKVLTGSENSGNDTVTATGATKVVVVNQNAGQEAAG